MGAAVLEEKKQVNKKAKVGRPKSSRPKPPMTQMNVRIDAELKKQGDRALERIGLSPSEAARALWEFAARHVNEPGKLQHIIEELEGGNEELNPPENQNNAQDGWKIMDEAYRALGITPKLLPEDVDERLAYYDELKEEAYWERLGERGLL